jgi:leader peptidase (prepilin peptidase)/N-methyltransferase
MRFYGLSVHASCDKSGMIYTFFTTSLLITALTALSFIDLRSQRLPDLITLPLLLLGLVVNFVLLDTLWAPVIGAVLGYASFVAIEIGYLRLRGRHGLGRGDAKLFAAGGAWCGAWLLPHIALIATVSAILFAVIMARLNKRRTGDADVVIFGPWLALGIAVCWIWRIFDPALSIPLL